MHLRLAPPTVARVSYAKVARDRTTQQLPTFRHRRSVLERRAGVSLSLSFSGRTARHRAAGGAARSAQREGPRPTATGRNADARRRSCAASARGPHSARSWNYVGGAATQRVYPTQPRRRIS